MHFAFWVVLAAAQPTTPESVIAELQRPGCPALFDRLTPSFQKSVPKEKWPSFCAAFASGGALKKIGIPKLENGFSIYDVRLENRAVLLGLAFDAEGRISGLSVNPSSAAEDAHVRYRWPLNKPTLVFWGGSDAATNHHVSVARQQRATDLIIVDAAGSDHQGDGHANTDYFAFGAEMPAPRPMEK